MLKEKLDRQAIIEELAENLATTESGKAEMMERLMCLTATQLEDIAQLVEEGESEVARLYVLFETLGWDEDDRGKEVAAKLRDVVPEIPRDLSEMSAVQNVISQLQEMISEVLEEKGLEGKLPQLTSLDDGLAVRAVLRRWADILEAVDISPTALADIETLISDLKRLLAQEEETLAKQEERLAVEEAQQQIEEVVMGVHEFLSMLQDEISNLLAADDETIIAQLRDENSVLNQLLSIIE